ncbi:hypothetical protein [Pseudoalteromonas marina]|uniref:Carrier domain-containing protein n=1 Tax=Pseudoalteromonas marina TaxID=267375 RepID=A0ABT9FI45_9GAMM|nr:hypothetical protein [Pseudoalteromonas marina]MDP2566473.1 hypothetical protein [Pseudoalteromonas marina]
MKVLNLGQSNEPVGNDIDCELCESEALRIIDSESLSEVLTDLGVDDIEFLSSGVNTAYLLDLNVLKDEHEVDNDIVSVDSILNILENEGGLDISGVENYSHILFCD